MPPLLGQPYLPASEARLRAVPLTPAAGADWTYTCPDGFYWDPLSLDAKLVTSVAAANRAVSIIFDDGANQIWIDSGPVQAALSTVDYLLGESIARDVSVAAIIKLSNPGDLRLLAGWRIRSVTGLLQAGDQWSVTLTVREYQINVVTGPRAMNRRQSLAAPRRPGRSY